MNKTMIKTYYPIGTSLHKQRIRRAGGIKCRVVEVDRHLALVELETGETLWVTRMEIL